MSVLPSVGTGSSRPSQSQAAVLFLREWPRYPGKGTGPTQIKNVFLESLKWMGHAFLRNLEEFSGQLNPGLIELKMLESVALSDESSNLQE